MKTFLKVMGIVLAATVVLGLFLIKKIDRVPYQQTEHFQQWNEAFSKHDWMPWNGVDTLKAGWAAVNFTPEDPVPMAGYGARYGKKYTSVHDSVYIRSIALEFDNKNALYLVSADLLIIPPNVTLRLKNLLSNEGISLDQVYLGTTHSHSSIGGWGEKLLGRLFAGKFDLDVEKLIADAIFQAIIQSKKQLEPANLAYWEANFPNGVKNRLKVEGKTEVDPYVRGLRVVTESGKSALMVTYQAHTTLINRRNLELSRDYPGFLVDSIKSQGIADFAVFFAGSVGSISSNVDGEGIYGKAQNLADSLVRYTQENSLSASFMEIAPMHEISVYSKGIIAPLPAASARISKNYALRPWVFRSLFGASPAYIKVTRIGNILMIGMPADFSGEIMKDLDAYAESKGIHLIITSFNGEYIGYVTSDKWYDIDLYETTTMSWFGYQTASYLTEVTRNIIDEMAKQSF